jgi:hypothetical protein
MSRLPEKHIRAEAVDRARGTIAYARKELLIRTIPLVDARTIASKGWVEYDIVLLERAIDEEAPISRIREIAAVLDEAVCKFIDNYWHWDRSLKEYAIHEAKTWPEQAIERARTFPLEDLAPVAGD